LLTHIIIIQIIQTNEDEGRERAKKIKKKRLHEKRSRDVREREREQRDVASRKGKRFYIDLT